VRYLQHMKGCAYPNYVWILLLYMKFRDFAVYLNLSLVDENLSYLTTISAIKPEIDLPQHLVFCII